MYEVVYNFCYSSQHEKQINLKTKSGSKGNDSVCDREWMEAGIKWQLFYSKFLNWIRSIFQTSTVSQEKCWHYYFGIFFLQYIECIIFVLLCKVKGWKGITKCKRYSALFRNNVKLSFIIVYNPYMNSIRFRHENYYINYTKTLINFIAVGIGSFGVNIWVLSCP